MTPNAPRPDRDWGRLAPGTRRRWVSAFGGPRSLGAVRRAERARLAYESGEHLPVAHSGHAGAYSVVFSELVTTTGVQHHVRVTSRVEGRRAGEYEADVGRLLGGRMEPAAFRARWRHRVRTVAGFEVEATPSRVVAMKTEAGPPPEPFYTGPLRRRRAA